MSDLILTAAALLLLAACVLYKAKFHPGENPDFFNIPNTNALRGIWSIVVILVHIPPERGNLIQDMIGSFGFVAVTFYFLFSGYGLSLGVLRKGFTGKGFWTKRLPKLLVPQLVVNILAVVLLWVLLGDQPTLSNLLLIAGWTKWLLACYLVFQLAHLLFRDPKKANIAIGLSLGAISLSMYTLSRLGVVTATIWPTEIWGFLWGILLALYFPRFRIFGKDRWLLKTLLACALSGCLGLLYLKFKPIVFWGDYLLKIALGCAIIGFVLLLNMRFSIGNRILACLGSISYEVYLVHSPVIVLIARALPELSSGPFILLSLAGTIAASLIVHRLADGLLKKIHPLTKA